MGLVDFAPQNLSSRYPDGFHTAIVQYVPNGVYVTPATWTGGVRLRPFGYTIATESVVAICDGLHLVDC